MRIAMLGGGATGLTLAYRLGQAGHQTVVFEQGSELGGLAAGTVINGTSIEKFYHHLFRTDRAITRLIHELGLGDRLLWVRPKTSNLIGGRAHQLDSPLTLLRFRPLPPIDRLRVGACIGYLKLTTNYHRFEHDTASAWIRRWMGRQAYDVLIDPMLRAKFGPRAHDISMAWLWSRFHERSTELGYMRFGFQQLYDRLGQAIHDLGGLVHLSSTVTSVRREEDGRFLVRTTTHDDRFDRVVSTLPTRVTLRVAPDLPAGYRQLHDQGEAYGAQCLILTLDRQFGETYWLSVNDAGAPFLVLVEHTNMMPPSDYGDVHILYLGNYLPMDDPRLRMSADEVLRRYLPYLRRLNPAFQASWVLDHRLFTAPYAQPIVTQVFPKHIPPHTTPIPGLYLANMLQVYPQDRGQNYAVAMAERVAALVLRDSTVRLTSSAQAASTH